MAGPRGAGLFIVLEGGDGVGKSTQATLLSSWLDELGVEHLLTREPGGTPVGEAIRAVVLSKDELDMPAETELLLILAARAAFVQEVVEPALARGTAVVADRFALSTLAYQGYGRGIDLGLVRDGLRIATGGLAPDLYLLFDLPDEEAEARRRTSDERPDRIERSGADFRRAVRDGYLELAAGDPSVEVINARGTPDEVHGRVRERLVARLGDRLPRAGATSDGLGGDAG